MSHNERLTSYLNSKNLTPSNTAKLAKLEYNKFKKYLTGYTKNPGLDVAIAIATAFPDLSLRWWLQGEGKMIKGREAPKDAVIIPKEKYDEFLAEQINFYREAKASVQELADLRQKVIDLMEENARLKG